MSNQSRSRRSKRTSRHRRRTASATRQLILNAAEQRLIIGGPEAIRLKEIAADVGISHPAILHHFGSREGMVEALLVHAMRGLQAEVMAGWPSEKVPDIEGGLERFSHLAAKCGYARLFAWSILSGRKLSALKRGIARPAAELVHAGRVRTDAQAGRASPDIEDTLFAVVLFAITVFGDALYGPLLRRSVSLGDDADTGRRFRAWAARVFDVYRTQRRGESLGGSRR